MTRVLPLPNPTRLVDKSKMEKTIVLSCVLGSFLLPSGLRLLLVGRSVVSGIYTRSTEMSDLF